MTTVPITLHVDADAAGVYESVTDEDRKKMMLTSILTWFSSRPLDGRITILS